VPTELSWTEVRRGATDLRSLLAFRRSGLAAQTRRRLAIGGGVVALLTVLASVVPAFVRDHLHGREANHLVAILPSLYLGFAILAIMTATTSGGGREVIPREQAVAFPISSVTEHFGSLLLAPLNIAWLIQASALLGSTSFVLGPHGVWLGIWPAFLWILIATSAGQVVGWVFEGIRRGPFGIWITRGITAATALGVASLVLTHRFTHVLDHSPTVRVYLVAAEAAGGAWGPAALGVAVLLAMLAVAVLLGLVPARWALHRQQREELRLESGQHEPRSAARSDLAAMVRTDRAGIWRSIPLRRGLFVLGLMPGSVALAGHLTWDLITILPGLVASGGALLFGVNAWCLDGRGALWRDSLPASPAVAFAAKAIVLLEVLVASAALTLVLAATRAGTPTVAEVTSVLAATLVVCLHVVSSAMAWSVRRPFASEMRSARATPAPPVVMVGYSARLALSTTILGLVFSATAYAPDGWAAVLLALPLLAVSGLRLVRTANAWAEPVIRARVIAVVAA
jgi:hypothetical protein